MATWKAALKLQKSVESLWRGRVPGRLVPIHEPETGRALMSCGVQTDEFKLGAWV